MYITQDMYNALVKSTRNLNVLVEILNSTTYAVLNQLQGIAISGDISFDSTSNYRRVCSGLKMIITSTSNLWPSSSSNIWFDKVIRLQVGIGVSPNIQWYNQGIFTIKSGTFDYSLSEKTASFDLLDLISNLDGTLNGKLPNEINILAEGITVNQAILSTVTSLPKINIANIQVNGLDATLPYDIIQEPNSTIYDLVKELVNLYMNYEFFFDEKGYFIVQKIKDLVNDAVVFDFSQTPIKLITNSSVLLDFSNVRNSVYVWGKTSSVDGSIASWVYRNRYSRADSTAMNVISDMITGDICYVTDLLQSYMWNGTTWTLLDFNVVPTFNIENIGEKIHVYSSDTIYTNDQAQLQAQYELWQYSNFADEISFSCVPIYYLSANQKIYVSSIQEPNIDGYYRITSSSLSLNTSGVQTINAVRLFYE